MRHTTKPNIPFLLLAAAITIPLLHCTFSRADSDIALYLGAISTHLAPHPDEDLGIKWVSNHRLIGIEKNSHIISTQISSYNERSYTYAYAWRLKPIGNAQLRVLTGFMYGGYTSCHISITKSNTFCGAFALELLNTKHRFSPAALWTGEAFILSTRITL
jgi:hypothetical protein